MFGPGSHNFFGNTQGANPMLNNTSIQPSQSAPSFSAVPAAPSGVGVTVMHNPSGSHAFVGQGPVVGSQFNHASGASVGGNAYVGPGGPVGSAQASMTFKF